MGLGVNSSIHGLRCQLAGVSASRSRVDASVILQLLAAASTTLHQQTARTCRLLEVKVLVFPRRGAPWAVSAAEMGHRRRGHCRRDPAVAGCSLEDLTPADREDMPAFGCKGAGRRLLPSPECTVGRIGGRSGSPSAEALPA
jgi:hypothetical protein